MLVSFNGIDGNKIWIASDKVVCVQTVGEGASQCTQINTVAYSYCVREPLEAVIERLTMPRMLNGSPSGATGNFGPREPWKFYDDVAEAQKAGKVVLGAAGAVAALGEQGARVLAKKKIAAGIDKLAKVAAADPVIRSKSRVGAACGTVASKPATPAKPAAKGAKRGRH